MIRISRNGWHTLLNFLFHTGLTFGVFAGGINQINLPFVCQIVSCCFPTFSAQCYFTALWKMCSAQFDGLERTESFLKLQSALRSLAAMGFTQKPREASLSMGRWMFSVKLNCLLHMLKLSRLAVHYFWFPFRLLMCKICSRSNIPEHCLLNVFTPIWRQFYNTESQWMSMMSIC